METNCEINPLYPNLCNKTIWQNVTTNLENVQHASFKIQQRKCPYVHHLSIPNRMRSHPAAIALSNAFRRLSAKLVPTFEDRGVSRSQILDLLRP
jgi:hypothetical protein